MAKPIYPRLFYSAIVGEDESRFVPRPTRYIDRVSQQDIVIDVRELSTKTNSFPSLSGMQVMPAYQIKTKLFFKDKRLVLVGSGLDYFRLEQEVVKLEQARFRSVRILKNGVLGLLGSKHLLADDAVALRLRTVSVNELVPAAIRYNEGFLFVNLQKGEGSAYQQLGVDYQNLSGQEKYLKAAGWAEFVMENINLKESQRIVFVHDDAGTYKTIYDALPPKVRKHTLFLSGGNIELNQFRDRLLLTAKVQNRVKRSCR